MSDVECPNCGAQIRVEEVGEGNVESLAERRQVGQRPVFSVSPVSKEQVMLRVNMVLPTHVALAVTFMLDAAGDET